MNSRKNSWDKSLPSIPRANSTSSAASGTSSITRSEPSASKTLVEDSSMPPPPLPRASSSKGSLPSIPSKGDKKVSKRQSRTSKKAREPPTISVSTSSSHNSNLDSAVAKESGNSDMNIVENGFSNLGLRTSRRGRLAGDEVLEEWASADLEDGEGLSESNSANKITGDGKDISPTKSNKTIFGIKRSRSNLRLFGNKNDSKESPTKVRRGSDTSSIFDPRASTSSTSSVNPSLQSNSHFNLSQSQSQNPNVAGRIGGWFSSMLHTPESSTSTTSSTSFEPSIPNSTLPPPSTPNKLFTFPSNALGRGSTPKKTSTSANSSSTSTGMNIAGRLGPLDRMLDKAVQYFLDTDSTADQCQDDIWVLGVRHPGFSPPLVPLSTSLSPVDQTAEASSDDTKSTTSTSNEKEEKRKRKKGISISFGKNKKGKDRLADELSVEGGLSGAERRPSSPSLSNTNSPSPSVLSSPTLSPQTSFQFPLPSPLPLLSIQTINGWPSQFYIDFYSRIALTYRSNFPPIPCSPSSPSTSVHAVFNSLSLSMGRGGNSRTSDGLSSDTGWGCMLRTGQSLLANTLITVHLGRDWRRSLPPPSIPPNSPSENSQSSVPPLQAEYTRILSLFIDDPSPLAPFSVHRFALMGKQLGKEVGEWFGPSTASGAIKSLVNDFDPAGLKVYNVLDGTVYKSEVEFVSTSGIDNGKKWDKPVLVLIGLRLGIDGVNPIYNEGIKAIFQFPQSMGIAGGRPSSSYYFVGTQANSLFYIDPHHPRPSIALKNPPLDLLATAQSSPISSTPDNLGEYQSRLNEFLVESYDDSSLRSYHTEKVRKMNISSLDPSMLLGFLIQDEADWEDFASRVRDLNQNHRPIFAIADTLPAWMGGRSTTTAPTKNGNAINTNKNISNPEELAGEVESFSEPDDWELDSSESIASPSPSPSPGDELFDELDVEGEDKAGVVDGGGEEEEEEWEEAPTSLSSVVTTPIRKEKVNEGSEDSSKTRIQSWHSIKPEVESEVEGIEETPIIIESISSSTPTPTTFKFPRLPAFVPLPPSPTESPKALEDTSRIGGAGVLVQGRSDTTVEFDKREEGWEGVGLVNSHSTRERV